MLENCDWKNTLTHTWCVSSESKPKPDTEGSWGSFIWKQDGPGWCAPINATRNSSSYRYNATRCSKNVTFRIKTYTFTRTYACIHSQTARSVNFHTNNFDTDNKICMVTDDYIQRNSKHKLPTVQFTYLYRYILLIHVFIYRDHWDFNKDFQLNNFMNISKSS